MSFVKCLRCKQCGREYPIQPLYVCEDDFGGLEVVYDYDAIRASLSRETIERRPGNVWRYRELLPVEGKPLTGEHSGWTPLIRAENLARELGVRELYLKDDSVNRPSLSYKDRVVAVALSKAVEFGFDTIGCASTGNLANAVASHGARAGLKRYIFIPADIEPGKILGSLIFDANIVLVRGNYDDVNRLCAEVGDKFGWAFVNVNLRPYYTEGAKTHGFEIAEQLGWRFPGSVVLPVAGGTILPKVARAFEELQTLGFVDDELPRMYAAQASGCNPVSEAFKTNADSINPKKPDTIAKSIAIGNPADGYDVLDILRNTNGAADDASDDEIIDAIKLLARTEGLFTEPAGGATLAVAKKLIRDGKIDPDQPIVICITGNGYKVREAVEGKAGAGRLIDANLGSFEDAYSDVLPKQCATV
ncbi:MAG: threonine synthase [Candidatus Hinthialibacter antarcticus]|nr:threonine synthase [Candidatus Hinthialibacter antarcticus]